MPCVLVRGYRCRTGPAFHDGSRTSAEAVEDCPKGSGGPSRWGLEPLDTIRADTCARPRPSPTPSREQQCCALDDFAFACLSMLAFPRSGGEAALMRSVAGCLCALLLLLSACDPEANNGSGRSELACATPAPAGSEEEPGQVFGPVTDADSLPLLTTNPGTVNSTSTANVELKPRVAAHRLEMVPGSTVRVLQSAPGNSHFEVTESNPALFKGTLVLDMPGETQELVLTLITEVSIAGARRPASATITYFGTSDRSNAPEALVAAKRNLTERLNRAHLDTKVANIEKVSSIPFLPLQPQVKAPLLGPAVSPLADVLDRTMELPLATDVAETVSEGAQTFPATVRVRYSFDEVVGFSDPPVRDSPSIQLNEFGRITSGVLRVVPVVQATESVASNAGLKIAVVITFKDPGSGQCDEVRQEMALPFPRPVLRIPPMLALYRAANMGEADPVWRTRDETSGMALYIATAESFQPLNVESLPLQPRFVSRAGLPEGREGQVLKRLEQMLGPWETEMGDGGPTGGLAANELVDSAHSSLLGPFLRLKDALQVLLESSARITSRGEVNGPRTFRTYATSKAAHLAGDPYGWFRDLCYALHGCRAVHVNDESEAALVLGPPNTAFRFFGQDNFGEAEGVTQIQTDPDGFVAIIPDLAVVGPCPVNTPTNCDVGSGAVISGYSGVPSRPGWLPGWFTQPLAGDAPQGSTAIETAFLADHWYGGPGYGLIQVIKRLTASRGITVPGPDVRDEAGLERQERGPRATSAARSISSFCLWDLNRQELARCP